MNLPSELADLSFITDVKNAGCWFRYGPHLTLVLARIVDSRPKLCTFRIYITCTFYWTQTRQNPMLHFPYYRVDWQFVLHLKKTTPRKGSFFIKILLFTHVWARILLHFWMEDMLKTYHFVRYIVLEHSKPNKGGSKQSKGAARALLREWWFFTVCPDVRNLTINFQWPPPSV